MAIIHLCTCERDLSGLLHKNTLNAGSYTNSIGQLALNCYILCMYAQFVAHHKCSDVLTIISLTCKQHFSAMTMANKVSYNIIESNKACG